MHVILYLLVYENLEILFVFLFWRWRFLEEKGFYLAICLPCKLSDIIICIGMVVRRITYLFLRIYVRKFQPKPDIYHTIKSRQFLKKRPCWASY